MKVIYSILCSLIAILPFQANLQAQENPTEAPVVDEQAAPPAEEEEASPFSVDLSASLYSSYMFRGLNLYDGVSFQPSIQPRYDFGDYGALTAGVWMHISADGTQDDVPEFFEMDPSLIYDFEWHPFTFSVGHFWYTYPDHSDHIASTEEIFSSVSVDTLLTPTLNFFYDYKEYDAYYFELNLSHQFEASGDDGYNFTPFVNFGFSSHGEKYYADDGLVQITYGVSTDITSGPITYTPQIAWTDAHDENAQNNFWFGVTAAVSY